MWRVKWTNTGGKSANEKQKLGVLPATVRVEGTKGGNCYQNPESSVLEKEPLNRSCVHKQWVHCWQHDVKENIGKEYPNVSLLTYIAAQCSALLHPMRSRRQENTEDAAHEGQSPGTEKGRKTRTKGPKRKLPSTELHVKTVTPRTISIGYLIAIKDGNSFQINTSLNLWWNAMTKQRKLVYINNKVP